MADPCWPRQLMSRTVLSSDRSRIRGETLWPPLFSVPPKRLWSHRSLARIPYQARMERQYDSGAVRLSAVTFPLKI